MAHKEYFPNHRVHEIIPEGRKGRERQEILSGFTMSLLKQLNTKRICLDCGEVDHNVMDPQHEMGLLQQ